MNMYYVHVEVQFDKVPAYVDRWHVPANTKYHAIRRAELLGAEQNMTVRVLAVSRDRER